MEELHYLKIKDIQANPYQPRLHFDEEKLLELAQSIKENGVIQPIIVRRSPLIGFELLAGERRLRASQLAGLTEIPAVIKHLSDDDLLYQAIIENLQRSDLNPIEEAHSYEKLIKKGLTHDEIAQIMGKSRPYITNLLRLLHLSESTRRAVETGKITQGHARQLVALSERQQAEWVQKIQEKDISVRQLETILSSKKKKTIRKSNQFISEEEEKLAKLLGTKVTIQQKKNGSGQLTIQFQNIEEFERIINSLK